jgi:hypothetical protein
VDAPPEKVTLDPVFKVTPPVMLARLALVTLSTVILPGEEFDPNDRPPELVMFVNALPLMENVPAPEPIPMVSPETAVSMEISPLPLFRVPPRLRLSAFMRIFPLLVLIIFPLATFTCPVPVAPLSALRLRFNTLPAEQVEHVMLSLMSILR